ncbi:hypothetical protein RHSIM_Rhsim05G0117800 [Rhododendron simsii]|uniref:Uncharacterized protein n=1 Tax=Rhododendron simsii TaxID=118357 RepID=A0A834H061_RHOSS|nr:hypothetical protein RHSIM_Rhsim05G0117800 [Rhododendron simsii]
MSSWQNRFSSSLHDRAPWDPKDIRRLQQHQILARQLSGIVFRKGHFDALCFQGRAMDDSRSSLFEGVPVDWSEGPRNGSWFAVCFNCNGSHKVVSGDVAASSEDCPECNENGLITCPLCC